MKFWTFYLAPDGRIDKNNFTSITQSGETREAAREFITDVLLKNALPKDKLIDIVSDTELYDHYQANYGRNCPDKSCLLCRNIAEMFAAQ